jgi:hypothetical protein
MWARGDTVITRQVLNDGRCWFALASLVVCDQPELLALYTPPAAPFDFPPGNWPTPDGLHPWRPRTQWEGHGMLSLQRPADWYAIFVFRHGPERRFEGWYVNMQEPFRRTDLGIDTQDLELDVLLPVGGGWTLKDDDVLERRVEEGRYTQEQVVHVRAEAARVVAEVEAGRQWWDPSWAAWEPDATWRAPAFPDAYRDLQR